MLTNLTHIIAYVNLAILLGCGALVVRLLSIGYSRALKTDKKNHFVKEAESNINKYLISSSENEGLRLESVSKFQVISLMQLIHSRARKDQLMKRLLKLKSELHGEFDILLKELYESLNLKKRSLAKLRSHSITQKIEGANEISEFDQSNTDEPLAKLLKSPFLAVRQMAQLSIVKMSPRGTDPLAFLLSHWSELTDWHELQIHQQLGHSSTMTQIASKHAVQLEKLLYHSNNTVKTFGLKLCILFQKVEHMPLIRQMIHSKYIRTRIWVLKAISEMGDATDVSAVTTLLAKSNDNHEREACLKALSQVGGEAQLSLLHQYSSSKNKSLRLMAVYAIDQITSNARQYFISVQGKSLSGTLKRTIDHVAEPLNVIV